MKFKYLVLGNHPISKYVNKRCLTGEEANNVKNELVAIGYEVIIETIKEENNER